MKVTIKGITDSTITFSKLNLTIRGNINKPWIFNPLSCVAANVNIDTDEQKKELEVLEKMGLIAIEWQSEPIKTLTNEREALKVGHGVPIDDDETEAEKAIEAEESQMNDMPEEIEKVEEETVIPVAKAPKKVPAKKNTKNKKKTKNVKKTGHDDEYVTIMNGNEPVRVKTLKTSDLDCLPPDKLKASLDAMAKLNGEKKKDDEDAIEFIQVDGFTDNDEEENNVLIDENVTDGTSDAFIEM